MTKVNFNNPVERNFHNMSRSQAEYMNQNNCTIEYDEELNVYNLYSKSDLVDQNKDINQLSL